MCTEADNENLWGTEVAGTSYLTQKFRFYLINNQDAFNWVKSDLACPSAYNFSM